MNRFYTMIFFSIIIHYFSALIRRTIINWNNFDIF